MRPILLLAAIPFAMVLACAGPETRTAKSDCAQMMKDNPQMMSSMMSDSGAAASMMGAMMSDPEMRQMMMRHMMDDPDMHGEMMRMMGGMEGMRGMERHGKDEGDGGQARRQGVWRRAARGGPLR